jgi:hypothetical protein
VSDYEKEMKAAYERYRVRKLAASKRAESPSKESAPLNKLDYWRDSAKRLYAENAQLKQRLDECATEMNRLQSALHEQQQRIRELEAGPVAYISNDCELPLKEDGKYWLYAGSEHNLLVPFYTSPQPAVVAEPATIEWGYSDFIEPGEILCAWLNRYVDRLLSNSEDADESGRDVRDAIYKAFVEIAQQQPAAAEPGCVHDYSNFEGENDAGTNGFFSCSKCGDEIEVTSTTAEPAVSVPGWTIAPVDSGYVLAEHGKHVTDLFERNSDNTFERTMCRFFDALLAPAAPAKTGGE